MGLCKIKYDERLVYKSVYSSVLFLCIADRHNSSYLIRYKASFSTLLTPSLIQNIFIFQSEF